MSLKHVDIEAGLRRLADRRIEEAMSQGKFDNLRGAGQPLNLEPMPADENARMTWWMLRILKNNDFTPEEIVWRKQIDGLKDELATATSVPRIRALVKAVNVLVYRINTLGTNALKSPVVTLSEEAELARLRERLGFGRVAGTRECANIACKSRNPVFARFCARCGIQIPVAD
jgi:hypothetical protein